MTKPSEMENLAERVKIATAEHQHAMLTSAFHEVHGYHPGGSGDAAKAWEALRMRFYGMVDIGAYESAAMTLVPEGWGYNVNVRSKPEGYIKPSAQCWLHPYGTQHAEAATPALALTAASLRARIKEKVTDGQIP